MPRAKSGSMHVVKVVSRQRGREYTSWLLRNSYREGGKVKKQTLANLSHLPAPIIELVRRALAGEPVGLGVGGLTIERSSPHGAVAAALGTLRRLGLEELIERRPSRQRDLVTAMIVSRVLEPASKLATVAGWGDSTLGAALGVADATEDEAYAALDWLVARQARIERRLADRHLADGDLVLYDLTSSYVTGRHCELAAFGYSRDRRRDRPQITYGLLTDVAGCPLAVRAYPGNTADPATVEDTLDALQRRFGLSQVVLVGDRGMLTSARIARLRQRGGLGWISSLRAPAIAALVEAGDLQLGLFDETNLAEISSPDYPGERLIVCRNPALAAERARKREELLAATEAALAKVAAAVAAGRLKSAAAIGLRAGRVRDRAKVGKHFELDIADGRLAYARDERRIAAEAALDGLYVIRTSLGPGRLDPAGVVTAYKALAHTERAFRALKGELEVRPIYHYRERRVRAHLLLCLLAAYLRWHLERDLAPLLFADEAPPARLDPVAPPLASQEARRKAASHTTPDGLPVRSLRGLLAHLATLTRNRVVPAGADERAAFEVLATPTPLQARAFELLGVSPARM
jgi:hypothetical protein